MIKIDHISVRLPAGKDPSREILHDIDIEIGHGEWVAVAGPNGSGKTTLLHAIAGVVVPSTGAVCYAGVDSGTPSTALVLQEPDNQFVASSVRNELLLSIPAATHPDALETACRAATERFTLAGLLDRNPHQLSGGEKQRLALATAWLAKPQILLLDEPAAFLDQHQRRRCVDFVRELNGRGVTVLWATPDGSDIEHASRVVALEDGAVVFDGTADSYEPEHPAVVIEAPAASSARSATPIVALDNVSFGYDGTDVLRDTSLDVLPGECVGIVGPNGSGKTTLLGLLSGVLTARAGSVRRDYSHIVERRQQQVFQLAQNPERLFFAETVLEELTFGLRKLGVDEAGGRERAAAALLRVGLPPDTFLPRSPFSLSLGEMRRLAFAVAITLEPRLLLMDEPTSSLDAAGKALFVELTIGLVGAGTAVVVASHDETVVERVCARTVALG
jgi:energy-coupling factor transport system ATP-binding protein